jgi:hypothetical protein
MNYAAKARVVTLANQRRGAISDEKGPEYAGSAEGYREQDADVLANFKRQDVRWGHALGGLASAFVYFGKHLDSIETFGRELLAAPDRGPELVMRGEGFISRLDDARNYLDLIECLLVDNGLHPSHYPTGDTCECESCDCGGSP